MRFLENSQICPGVNGTLMPPVECSVVFMCPFPSLLVASRNLVPAMVLSLNCSIHSFFNHVAPHEPSAGAVAQRVLAIRSKRCAKKPVDFLTQAESEAVLNAPDQTTGSGRRDRTLPLVALQTGFRVSELIGLRCQDVVFGDRHPCALYRQRPQNALHPVAQRSS